MKCYNRLPISNHEIVSSKIYDYIVNETNILQNKIFWTNVSIPIMLARVPELRAFLDSNNLNANQMAVIWAPPGLQGAVHIDYGKNVRILWPIKNCEGSKTKFFHIDPSNIKLSRLENGEPYYNITQQEPYEMIDEMELLTPVVFDSSIAHGIYTNPMVTEARLTFTIGVRESLSHWL